MVTGNSSTSSTMEVPSVLGHPFNQRLVPGELLKSHAGHSGLANAALTPTHQFTSDIKGAKMPRNVSGYIIVFGIISQSDKPDPHLPFLPRWF